MKRIAFVCTGNTCRSPMAEHIMRKKLADANIDGYEVVSYGVRAAEGADIGEFAKAALEEMGIKAERHSATTIKEEHISSCDLIIALTYRHLVHLNFHKKATVLDALVGCGDIVDPYGGTLEDYKACAATLDLAITKLVQLLPALFTDTLR